MLGLCNSRKGSLVLVKLAQVNCRLAQAHRQRGGGARGGNAPPIFVFAPRFFSCPLRYFFGRKKLVFLGGKNVKIGDFGQKKPSDFGEDLFFFIWRSPAFGRKICDFGQKKPSHFGENLGPPDFNFAPRSREAGDAPGLADISKNVSVRNLLERDFGLYDLLVLANRLLPIFRKTELAAPGLRISSKQCCYAISQNSTYRKFGIFSKSA